MFRSDFLRGLRPSAGLSTEDIARVLGTSDGSTRPIVGRRACRTGALIAGWVAAIGISLVMLYQIPGPVKPDGTQKQHFCGSGWALLNLGFDTKVWVGFVLVGVLVSVVGTIILRALKVPAGADSTRKRD